jgi:hypothetical protein
MVLSGESRLIYSADFSESCPLLFEATSELIDEIKDGQVFVKFCSKGVGYLCSNKHTYQIRRADNSNTLLFGFQRGEGINAIDSSSDGVIQVEKLWSDEVPDGDISTVFNQRTSDVLPSLAFSTMWSEGQIKKHLESSDNYFISEGKWTRIPDEQFFCDLDAILNLCAIIGGGKDFNSEEVWIQMNEFNESENRIGVSLTYVQYLLSRLTTGETCENKGGSDWPLVLTLDENKVIVYRGKQVLQQLLSEERRQLDLETFLAEWKALLETSAGVEAFMIDDSTLRSNFLAQAISGRASLEDEMLMSLDSRTLSVHIDERLQQLFKIRSKWLKSEFESYIVPLLPPGTKPESILLKSCRFDEESEGNWYYSSKF